MNLGVRTILLAAAVVLFLIALFSDENYADLLALGLLAFAGAFLAEGLGWGDRTFGTTRRDDTT
jgi:hypothetical protein